MIGYKAVRAPSPLACCYRESRGWSRKAACHCQSQMRCQSMYTSRPYPQLRIRTLTTLGATLLPREPWYNACLDCFHVSDIVTSCNIVRCREPKSNPVCSQETQAPGLLQGRGTRRRGVRSRCSHTSLRHRSLQVPQLSRPAAALHSRGRLRHIQGRSPHPQRPQCRA